MRLVSAPGGDTGVCTVRYARGARTRGRLRRSCGKTFISHELREIAPPKRDDSFIATALLDLAALLRDDSLYRDVENERGQTEFSPVTTNHKTARRSS